MRGRDDAGGRETTAVKERQRVSEKDTQGVRGGSNGSDRSNSQREKTSE